MPIDEALIALFGMESAADVDDPKFHPLFKEASPSNHLTADDPPVLVYYNQRNDPLPPNSAGSLHIHHPKFAFAIKEKTDRLRVDCRVLLRKDHPDGFPIDKVVRFSVDQFEMR